MPIETFASSGLLNADGTLSPELYESIARQIGDGSCVLFLGPSAISVKQPDGSYRPLTELCANFLAQKYGLELLPEEAESLSYVTSLLLNRSVERVADIILRGEIQKFYQQHAQTVQLSPALEQLSYLPFRIIINTTPDDFFAELYEAAASPKRFAYYNFEKPEPKDPLYEFGDKAPPLIYNLFGYYKDKPQSMVLSYSDQLNFINKITGQQNEGPPNSLLKALDKPIFHLFLGFDFDDWSLRVLFNAIFRNERKNMQPFAYKPHKKRDTGAQARVFFQGEFGMMFPKVDLDSFIAQLVATAESMKAGPATDAAQMRGDILILYNDTKDDAGYKIVEQRLLPLRVRIRTHTNDALGGDPTDWIRATYQKSQVVIPLLSADFFSDENPALPVLNEIIAANNTRNNGQRKLLVLPLLMRTVNIQDTVFNALRTIHPSDGNPVLGNNQDAQLGELTETLKRYLEKLPATS